jgi:hypothetical protein
MRHTLKGSDSERRMEQEGEGGPPAHKESGKGLGPPRGKRMRDTEEKGNSFSSAPRKLKRASTVERERTSRRPCLVKMVMLLLGGQV